MSNQLKAQAVSGVKWTTVSTVITTATEFLRIAVLARLLSPIDFGLMGMVTVVIGFSQAFVDMGISNAIIYRQDSTRRQLSSLYWLNIISGVVVFIIIIALSPLIVKFYREPRLIPLLPWAALSFLIVPFGQQFQILLQKDLRFKTLAKVEIITSLIGMLIAIIAAKLGQGVFSLIWGVLVSVGTRSFLLGAISWLNWRPLFHFKREDLKGYLSFGLYQMGERSINYFSANVDYLFVGRFLGPKVLGIYTLAYQLVVTPFIKLNPILTKVAFPIFSKKQTDNEALRRGYLEMIKLLAFCIFPLLVGLAIVAPLFVPIIYGAGWDLAVPLIQILALLGMLKTIGNPSGSILLGKGRADIGFIWNVFAGLINALVFWFAAQRGVFLVAWSWTILSIFYFIGGFWILRGIVGFRWKEYISVLFQPATFSILMGCIVYGIYLILDKINFNQQLSLITLIIIGGVFYSFFIFFFERKYCINILKLMMPNRNEVS